MFRRAMPLGIAVLAGLLATAAFAGDLDIINAPEIDVSQSAVAEGWYIRGDLGYSGWVKGGEPDYSVYAPDGTVFSREGFDSGRFSKPFSYGIGAGYQFNDTLRADVTTDFFNGALSGSSNIDVPCSLNEPAGTSCGFSHKADYTAINIMANGYADLGTFAGITPYVGAGLGVTRLNWGSLNTQTFCEAGSSACSGDDYTPGTLPGMDSWRFTYALMAGASVDISTRVKLDLGYRFSDMRGGDMFRYGAMEQGFGARGAKGHDDGFQRHEFRAGLRITTW